MYKINVELRDGDSFGNYIASTEDARNSDGVFYFQDINQTIVGIPLDFIKYFTITEKAND